MRLPRCFLVASSSFHVTDQHQEFPFFFSSWNFFFFSNCSYSQTAAPWALSSTQREQSITLPVGSADDIMTLFRQIRKQRQSLQANRILSQCLSGRTESIPCGLRKFSIIFPPFRTDDKEEKHPGCVTTANRSISTLSITHKGFRICTNHQSS